MRIPLVPDSLKATAKRIDEASRPDPAILRNQNLVIKAAQDWAVRDNNRNGGYGKTGFDDSDYDPGSDRPYAEGLRGKIVVTVSMDIGSFHDMGFHAEMLGDARVPPAIYVEGSAANKSPAVWAWLAQNAKRFSDWDIKYGRDMA